ncbi:MAG: hypothetical protein ABFS32_09030 [Bacteroidota bacterium]
MIKLDPEHIHLLLDEPIYVLHEHFDAVVSEPSAELEKPQISNHKGENKKGIVIINHDDNSELMSQEDETFLFKGLNALDLTLEDVLITYSEDSLDDSIEFKKQIFFSSNPDPEKLYKVETIGGVQYLECDSLQSIRPDIELQKKFWIALKTLFNRLAK